MKGLLLALLAFALIGVLTVVGLRVYRGRKEYRVFLVAFGVSVVVFVVLHKSLAPDLGFLPPALVEPSVGADFWNGGLVLAMLFHGFWVFSYVACVGPSARIALALHERGPQGMRLEEIVALYGPQSGLDAILARRLPKLIAGRYIAKADGRYIALPRGRRYGRIAVALKRLLGSGAGG